MAFVGIFVCLDVLSPGPISYFEINFLSSNTGPLAFAAMGQTVVFLIGGFDLSCGAVLSLVNVIMALHTGDSLWSQVLMCFAGLGIGAAVGAINGFFIAYGRLQPVVVTLAVMFIILGLNLLLMPDPGGYFPYGLSMVFTGDLIPDGFPAALLVIPLALGLWAIIKRSRFGTALYAVGSNEDAAFANGISVTRTKFLGYTLAGTFYGAGGVFLSAQTSSGDPLVGSGMLLLIFAATILGGTRIGGGEGGCLGTVFAAFTLMLISNVLIVLNWSPHVMPITEAVILLLAVIGASIGRDTSLAEYWRVTGLKISGLRHRSLPSFHGGTRANAGRLTTSWTPRASDELKGPQLWQWTTKNWDVLRLMVPAWTLLVVVYILVVAVIGGESVSVHYLNSLLTLGLFLAVLGLGQGAVVLTGGLDLSVPHTLAFTGVVLAAVCNGMDGPAYWAVPMVLAIGIGVGLFNGIGVVLFGLPAIVVTLATNGIMQGAGLLFTGGIPTGRSPPALVWFFTGTARRACARRLVPHRLRRCRLCRAAPHDLRPARLRGRQQRAGGEAIGRARRLDDARRLHAERLLLGARRRADDRLLHGLLSQHGPALPAAGNRRRAGGRHAPHRWARALSRHFRRRAAADGRRHAGLGLGASLRLARHHLRYCRARRRADAARTRDLTARLKA